MVLPRVVTAILLVPVVIAAVWYGHLPFFIFAVGISLLCFWEYATMAEQGGYPNQLFVGFFGCVLVLLSLYLDGMPLGPINRAPGPVFVLMLWCFLSFVREFFRKDMGHSFLCVIATLAGVVLCGLFLGHLVLIRELRFVAGEGFQFVGRKLVFFLFFVIWAVDVGAWFVGRLVGRFALASRISPKKTWEGALGGTLIGCAVGWFCRESFLRGELGMMEAVIYAFIIAIAAQVSDLIESIMKRSFNVKNSSELLPGHGGILDRFDSLLFAAPFFYYLLIGTGRFS